MSDKLPVRGGPCVAFPSELQTVEAKGWRVLPPPGHSSPCIQVKTFPWRGRVVCWLLWKSWPAKWLGIRALVSRFGVSPYRLVAATVLPPEDDEDLSDNLSQEEDE